MVGSDTQSVHLAVSLLNFDGCEGKISISEGPSSNSRPEATISAWDTDIAMSVHRPLVAKFNVHY